MNPSIATVTLGESLPCRITAAAKAGFKGIELFDTDLEAFGADAKAIRRMIGDAGMNVASYFPLREVEGVPAEARQATRDRAAAYFDRAAELGAPMVMMCSATDEGLSCDRSLILDDLAHLAEMARARGLRLAYEALSWGCHMFDYRDAAKLVSEIRHPNFGLVLDSFHIFARGHPLDEITDIPAEHIFLVQVSDAPRLNLSYLDWSRSHRTLPGRGSFDLQAFTTKVRATGYDGVFSLECFSDELRAEKAQSVAEIGYAALNGLWSAKDD